MYGKLIKDNVILYPDSWWSWLVSAELSPLAAGRQKLQNIMFILEFACMAVYSKFLPSLR